MPEIELFDAGDLALLRDLISDGTLDPSPRCSIVMGVQYGFQLSMETMLYARCPLGASIATLAQARDMLGLQQRAS